MSLDNGLMDHLGNFSSPL